jgi:hypothetical protein
MLSFGIIPSPCNCFGETVPLNVKFAEKWWTRIIQYLLNHAAAFAKSVVQITLEDLKLFLNKCFKILIFLYTVHLGGKTADDY